MEPAAINRLQWKCRRGLLELDLVFKNYFEKTFEESDAAVLDELLDLPDNDLWDIVAGRSDAFDPKFEGVVARLRAA